LIRAVDELSQLVERLGGAHFEDREILIEARRHQYSALEDDDPRRSTIPDQIFADVTAAQSALTGESHRRNWALLEFYKAEAALHNAERRDETGKRVYANDAGERRALLNSAREAFALALPYLSCTDSIIARECKEGLAGALSGLAECTSEVLLAASYLREARALGQEVVDSARLNTPDEEYAGALENLAETVRILGQKFPEQSRDASLEERRLLEISLQVYEGLEDSENADRVRVLLETIARSLA
jgi:hypothetical protein